VRDDFAAEGIEVIAPDGEFRHADLPMISPRIKGAIENLGQTVILDVGGDPAGCRTLGRFVDVIEARGFEMLFVVNSFRPFTTNVEEVIQMKGMLEFSSKLKITEFVCNNNLMEDTDAAIVSQGIELLQECSDRTGIRFERYLVLEEYSGLVPAGLGGKQRLVMSYTLKKPWEKLFMKGI
jgi:hypothetical protein